MFMNLLFVGRLPQLKPALACLEGAGLKCAIRPTKNWRYTLRARRPTIQIIACSLTPKKA